jgi:hypothetical protein
VVLEVESNVSEELLQYIFNRDDDVTVEPAV